MSQQNLPQMGGQVQVIMTNVHPDADPIAVADALTENDIKYSANMKLQLPHKGVVEVEQTWEAGATYGASGDSSTLQYIAPAARPNVAIADGDDGLVITANGTFTEVSGYKDQDSIEPFRSFQYDGNASSSSANDGLVGPLNTAVAAENDQAIVVDTPGRMGGEDMDSENVNTLPGYPVASSSTHTYALAAINAMAVASDASTLTIALLQTVGASDLVTANLADYKTGVAAESTIDIETLQQVIYDANVANR